MRNLRGLGIAGLVAATTIVTAAVAAPVSATTPTCFGKPATITGSGYVRGTAERDVIVVTRGSEVHARGGDDLVCGAFLAYGGRGDDHLRYAGDASDGELAGGTGDDVVVWRAAGWGELLGGGGDDVLRARGGDQLLSGEAGRDLLRAGAGDDLVFGGPGPDDLHGGTGTDHGDGGPGDDTCSGFQSGSC